MPQREAEDAQTHQVHSGPEFAASLRPALEEGAPFDCELPARGPADLDAVAMADGFQDPLMGKLVLFISGAKFQVSSIRGLRWDVGR